MPDAIESFSVTGPNGFTAQGKGGDTFTDPNLSLRGGYYGDNATYLVTAVVSHSAAYGTMSNTVTATLPTDVTINSYSVTSATDTDYLAPPADLAISVTDGADTAIPGTTHTYTMTVTNNGPTDVVGAHVVGSFPIVYSAPIVSLGAQNSATVGALSGLQSVNSFNSNASTNTLSVASANSAAAASMTYSGGLVSNSISTSSVINGGGGGYISDWVPFDSVTYTADATASASGFTASGNGNIDDYVDLPSGASITYTITAAFRNGTFGVVGPTVTVTAPTTITDTNLANNSASDLDFATPVGDLSITENDNITAGFAGVPTTYTFVVTNSGPSAIYGARVSDVFPPQIVNVSYTATLSGDAQFLPFLSIPIFGPGGETQETGQGNISDLLYLAPGATATYQVTVVSDQSAVGDLTNTATVDVSGGGTDTNPNNNSVTNTRSLAQPDDLSVTVSHSDELVIAGGDPTTFTVTVHNNSPRDVTGAHISNTLFAGSVYTYDGNFIPEPYWATNDQFTATGTTGATGFTVSGAGDIDDVVNIPAGGSITYIVTASTVSSAASSSDLGDIATVTPPTGFTDMIPANNATHDLITITQRYDLSLTISDDAGASSATGSTGAAMAGGTIVYTIVVTNHGPSDADWITLYGYFPDAITYSYEFIDAAGNHQSNNYPDLFGYPTYSNLAPGQSETFIVTAQLYPTYTGPMTTTIEASGYNNNSATITDIISPS
jgi:uncharacterized repeat protein (TIGR01451 family)